MRVVIISDSLGCPRDEMPVENTWLYKFLDEYKCDNVFYTFIKHGQTTNMVDYGLVNRIKPDVIILQMGIVDCSRRATGDKAKTIISSIPIIRTMWKRFASNHHYFLTKVSEKRKVSPKMFEKNIKTLVSMNYTTKVIAIRIADAGENMIGKIYNIEKDIKTYNNILKTNIKKYIDPFKDKLHSCYLEPDGHHLNIKGHMLVFNALRDEMDEI